MKNKGQKKLQREINKIVRDQNQILKEDSVFRGRYIIRQDKVINFCHDEYFDKLDYIKVRCKIIDTRSNEIIGAFELNHSNGNSNRWLVYDLFQKINPIFCEVYEENREEVFGHKPA